MLNLTVDSLAYFDTFAGLISCKVTAINGSSPNPVSNINVEFTLTETRGAYSKGEKLWSSSLWVIPKKAINRRQYSTTISHYTVNIAKETKP